ncbi:18406_t:CDS:2 [Gigaspora rosea]|nr:18406_t:CDS:2 [Gigaspora rosea]
MKTRLLSKKKCLQEIQDKKKTKNITNSLALKKYWLVTRKKIKDQIRYLFKEIRDILREDKSITRLNEFTETSKIFPEYLLQIEYLQNRMDELEAHLGIGTSNYSESLNEFGDEMVTLEIHFF